MKKDDNGVERITKGSLASSTHQLVGVTQENRLDRDPGEKGA